MKPFLGYGQTEAYVAPRQDNLNNRIISALLRQSRQDPLDITPHSLKRTPHIQLTDKGFSDPRTLNATKDYQSSTLNETSNPPTETS